MHTDSHAPTCSPTHVEPRIFTLPTRAQFVLDFCAPIYYIVNKQQLRIVYLLCALGVFVLVCVVVVAGTPRPFCACVRAMLFASVRKSSHAGSRARPTTARTKTPLRKINFHQLRCNRQHNATVEHRIVPTSTNTFC